MKKRKFSWLLNIATICLCVCAIAIGVYSATTASLTVSGSIGFTAHDCKVEVSGKYYAYSSETAEERTEYSFTKTTVGGRTESDYNQTQPITKTLYFSDYATDGHGDEIVFNLTITNKSDFKITVKVATPTLKTTSGDAITSVTCTSSNEKFTLEAKDEEGSSATITLTYKLEDIDNASNITDGKFSISLDFAKWTQFYTESITEKFYAGSAGKDVTTAKLCTTMGHSIVGTGDGTDGETPVDIQWYAFAVKGVDTGKGYVYNNTWYDNNTSNGDITDRWYSLNGINFNDNLEMENLPNGNGSTKNVSAKGQTFWFIQQYITAGGYYMGTNSSDYVEGAVAIGCPHNYAKSSMYTYLTDTETESNYLSATGIKDDGLYASIDARDVDESYTVSEWFESDCVTDCVYTCKFSSRFWLISEAEFYLLTNSKSIMSCKTPGIGSQDLSKTYNGYGADWHTRSPGYTDSAQSTSVWHDGFGCDSAVSLFGIRSAFQIEI